MAGFLPCLRTNRNYRWLWTGQVVSEIGDHFNNIAVFGLALEITHSGLVITGILLSRAIPAMLAGPLAGVILDRFDRRKIMIASDLIRMVVALGFVLAYWSRQPWQLYVFSALLMFASPFFTSGRAAILPSIASADELHSVSSITQTTQWVNVSIGAFLGGLSAWVGYEWAFLFNALSFLFSAFCISRLRPPKEGFRAYSGKKPRAKSGHAWHDYLEGLRYIRATPLIVGIVLISVGWASGGGAAQILFSLFGELVFKRGTAGIGLIWGWAGIGLVVGGILGHGIAKRVSFEGYKKVVFFAYLVHGGMYILFSQMQSFGWALACIALSRLAVAVSSVLNFKQLLRHVSNQYRGRVFATNETLVWSTMMLSMAGAGIASQFYSPRTIGAVSGVLSASTAIFWGWANWAGRLPEPEVTLDGEEMELHGTPIA